MNPTLLSLLGFTAWFLVLTFALAFWRVRVSVSTGKAINSYSADGADLPGFGHRLTRARDNCFETLPVFVAIALAANALGKLDMLNELAPWILLSRIIQSLIHMVSTSSPAIVARATMLTVQLVIYSYWVVGLLFLAR
jgi:uncharacterized MAPEG superfamily protein